MDLTEAMAVIESHEFAARTGAASDWATFAIAVAQQRAFAWLSLDQSANVGRVAERVLEIARMEIDPRYEHPLDAALAAYLLIVSTSDRAVAEMIAGALLRAPQLWWAGKLARQTLLDRTRSATPMAHRIVWSHRERPSARANDSDDIVLVVPVVGRGFSISSGRVRCLVTDSSSSERTYPATRVGDRIVTMTQPILG